ncbi:putative dipeptidyl-peptidase [Naematelia encephala]|uniref:Putative dipeptidyl-peptidase n=1 Tax=Naematelia encephala TaxID=71784 RepID=A0A1Y2BEZ1_9TREE|nr:putative dipeptidyl-peptidase [Naematelia encephala]
MDSAGDSDVSYHDRLETEPFDEKVGHADGPDKRFQDDPRMEEGEEDGEGYPLRPRKKSRKILATLIGIVVFATVIGALAATQYSAPSYYAKSGSKHITLEHILNGTFGVRTKQLDWVKEAPDGTFSHINTEGNIVLNTVQNITTDELLVDSSLVLDREGNRLKWQSWALSADSKYVLFKTDHVKQWRHSAFGNYWVHRLSDHATFPIDPPTSPPEISIVRWSPVGHNLAFVKKNDLYVVPSDELYGTHPEAIRVTNDGSDVVFNGVPDWVYEEEVFETDSAVWWSPDGQTLAFTRSDEAAVLDYKLQYYNPTNDAFDVDQYPVELDMKYPKPGTPNPLVSVYTFSIRAYLETLEISQSKQALTWPGEMPLDSRIITEIAWVATDGLLVKEIDRAARRGQVIIFQGGASEGQVVRHLGKGGEEGDDGWIDHGQNVIAVDGEVPGYLDIVPNEGYNHIAFFSPITATEPTWITSGDWEVTSIAGIDHSHGAIYFMAATPSIDRHLYTAFLPTSGLAEEYEQNYSALTDTAQPGYYEVSFSPGAQYYVLSYKGPDVPWQRLMEVGEDGVDLLLEGNGVLNETLAEYMAPLVQRTTLVNDGNELNMLQIFPPNMDASGRKKYPVLIRVYGGPGSQMVSNRFERDWHTFLACEKKYIIVMIDGRGTGFKGRPLRNPVTDELGHYEVLDQIAAAAEMVKKEYVDRNRIGIWGWSYGGYMTCKAIEADSGVFTLGMAVAPVTNWLYYDSIYTERYMNTPTSNEQGYLQGAVNNVSAFGNVDFLWAHGSGDDNVHYLNTASLLDKLTQRHVRGWRFRMFTDSNHNMDKREAYRELYQWMTDYLDEKWGRGGNVHHS